MLRWLGRGAAIALAASLSGTAYAQASCDAPMRFEVHADGSVSAVGTICRDTSEVFRSFLRSQGRLGVEWPVVLRISSPGGNALQSLALGRLIRQQRMDVEVTGPCASGCTLAAMGGVRRTVSSSGIVAVHQFFSPVQVEGHIAEDVTQRLVALIDEYIEEMGVDSAFQRMAYRTPRNDFRVLSREELVRYRFLTETSARPVVPVKPHSPSPSPAAASPAAPAPPAQVNFASTLRPRWTLNQSLMSLESSGEQIIVRYVEPRPGMVSAGVRPGSTFLTGRYSGKAFTGTAYTFSRRCGPLAYSVHGEIAPGDLIQLSGYAPRVDGGCQVAEYEARRIELVPVVDPTGW